MEAQAEAASFKKLEAEAEAKALHAEAQAEAEAIKNSPLPHHCMEQIHADSCRWRRDIYKQSRNVFGAENRSFPLNLTGKIYLEVHLLLIKFKGHRIHGTKNEAK